MNKEQLENICKKTCGVVVHTGEFIKRELGKVSKEIIEQKSLNSLVSYVDKEAEKQLVSGLGAIVEGAGFLTEEKTVAQEKAHYRWIIDPLDGTTNFLHQLPFFSVSVALEVSGALVLGIVYEVMREECFYAYQGGGAFLNEQSIQVTANESLSEALVATGFPYYDYGKMASYLESLGYLMKNTRGIRRLGSAALDLAYVACGRFDAFFEYSLQPWDIAAGIVLVEEAGGVVTDFEGGKKHLTGEEVVAGAIGIQKEIQQLLEKAFSERNP